MSRARRSAATLLAALLTLGAVAAPTAAAPRRPETAGLEPSAGLSAGQLQFQLLASGLSSPVGVVNAADGTDRLFVLERRGTVRVIDNRQLLPDFFLDIRNAPGGIAAGGERGLLGLAFHPWFDDNRKVFAYYTQPGGDIVIAEFTANAEGTAVNANTYDPLLTIEHSAFSNHNGGQLMFGSDLYLYAFVGDGGGGGDPLESGQNLNTLLGKALRISPDGSGGYGNPAGNPFIGQPGLDEIWAYGLRNPWRASFDRQTGDLWIADVGQDQWEEVNKVGGNPGGVNYGWDNCEGNHDYESHGQGCPTWGGQTGPVAEYATADPNCSVTGGYVYRGEVYLDMAGQYLFGDFCSGNVWTLDAASPAAMQHHRQTGALITSFGEGEDGELYMTDFNGGNVWKVVAPTFGDVMTSTLIDDITWLHFQGITNGCGGGNYCPGMHVAREQMASFIARALNLPASSTNHFDDDDGSVHEADINKIADAGITIGCGHRQYCPALAVTRAEMASFLARGWNLPQPTRDWFTDDNGNDHENDINRIAEAEITLGCSPGIFCPTWATTREQMAAFLRRAMTP